MLLKSSDIGFQKLTPTLNSKLLKVLHSKNPQLLLCLPKFFKKQDFINLKKDAAKFWKTFIIYNRKELYKLINFEIIYGNTQFTRNYMDLNSYAKKNSKFYFDKVRKIWENRNVIIIEGYYTRFGVNNDLLANASSVKRILCPSQNAFDKYESILSEALKQDKNALFLLAVGPTATILAHDLCEKDIQAIDIGHLDIEYEWYMRKATSKIPIPNKYVNEANSIINNMNDALEDYNYTKQIIFVVK